MTTVSIQEWVRDNIDFLTKLMESNDQRYVERWKAQEQAILKQEAAQAQYNIAHNGLLADNRRQSEDFNLKIEKLAQEINTHFQLPIHPGAQVQIELLAKQVQQIQEFQLRMSERQAERKEIGAVKTESSRWTIQIFISVFFSSLAALISIVLLILKLLGK